jgi:RNA-directed DNA polymerase
MTATPEPKGKLGIMTTQRVATAVPRAVMVNGPEDDGFEWDAVDWRVLEDDVRRLRQRIFTASQVGDLKKVRNLQKLMLRSRANTLLSVRRVTERNAGRLTAGIDGETALDSSAKATLAVEVHRDRSSWQSRPVRRVYIPKANGKRRPLGIPVLRDRALQARVVNALEPEWEARFEPRSYGFRPGRGCHDAIEAIYWTLNGQWAKRQWVLDADLSAAFDRIDHDRLLAALGTFPARELVRQWLKAGVVERGRVAPTEEGTPQGGVISPLLLNVALHGMEVAAGVRYSTVGVNGAQTVSGTPALVRYADDFVVMCHTRDQAERARSQLDQWLALRGLSFNEDKTRIVHIDDGFDFLGFNVRRYGGKLLIKPSKAAVARFRQRLTDEVHSLRGSAAIMVIVTLNPIIRGWAAYYRGVVSKKVFSTVDDHLWRLTYRWALRSHPNKSKHWIIARYFDQFNVFRQNRWVFGDRDSGAYLLRFDWTKIVRHRMVMGTSSPDDPALTKYWADRRRNGPSPLNAPTLRMLRAQKGRCPACGDLLLLADHEPQSPLEWEQWIKAARKALRVKALIAPAVADPAKNPDGFTTQHLLHAHCARRLAGKLVRGFSRPETPSGLA